MKTCPTCQRRFIDTQEACPLDEAVLGVADGTKSPPGLGRVLGSYRLISLLGEGGMGNIYVGGHTRLNRYVAIKVLRSELQNRRDLISRFFDEARTVNKIKHANIVESIDLVEDVVDGAYCVLELLQGADLRTRLRAGALPLDSAIRIGAQIGDALSAVHAINIVHRDLKPENLILIKRGGHDDFVKLIDFGVAQVSEEVATGIPFGTAAYMAPEQAAGERVDGRADVYSLGVLLFEMMTGWHPFPSKTDNEYLLRHADDAAPRPSKLEPRIPKELDALILRCLAKSPAERFPTAAAVAVALRAIDVTAKKRSKGGGWKWVVAGGIVVGAAAAAVFVLPAYLDKDTSARADVRPTGATSKPAAPTTTTPTEVTISFVSEPKGARVYRAGETAPLGTTPFSTTFGKSTQPVKVRLELAGYKPAEAEVALDDSHENATELEPKVTATKVTQPRTGEKRATPIDTKPRTKPVQREGTMDPFAPN